MKKFKTWESAVLIALCISLCTALWAQGKQQDISRNLLRLHVVAAGNTEREQALKLRVRDAVLTYISPKLESAENPEEAERIVTEELENIAVAAKSAAEGQSVSVSLGEESFPTKYYEGFSLPAGRYRALRIVLGEGMGENWWCVVFPPVCLSAAQTEQLRAVMGEEEYGIITESEDYAIRFKILELWGKLTN